LRVGIVIAGLNENDSRVVLNRDPQIVIALLARREARALIATGLPVLPNVHDSIDGHSSARASTGLDLVKVVRVRLPDRMGHASPIVVSTGHHSDPISKVRGQPTANQMLRALANVIAGARGHLIVTATTATAIGGDQKGRRAEMVRRPTAMRDAVQNARRARLAAMVHHASVRHGPRLRLAQMARPTDPDRLVIVSA
jgi:hypothetical protein